MQKKIVKTAKSFSKELLYSNSLKLENANEDVYNYLMGIPLNRLVLCESSMLYISTTPVESFNKVILKEKIN